MRFHAALDDWFRADMLHHKLGLARFLRRFQRTVPLHDHNSMSLLRS